MPVSKVKFSNELDLKAEVKITQKNCKRENKKNENCRLNVIELSMKGLNPFETQLTITEAKKLNELLSQFLATSDDLSSVKVMKKNSKKTPAATLTADSKNLEEFAEL